MKLRIEFYIWAEKPDGSVDLLSIQIRLVPLREVADGSEQHHTKHTQHEIA